MLPVFLLVTVLLAPYLMLLLDFTEYRNTPKLVTMLGWAVIVIGPLLVLHAWPSTADLSRVLILPSIGVAICSFWVREKLRQLVIWFDLIALNLSWVGVQLYTNQYPRAAFGDYLQAPLRLAAWLVPLLVVLHLANFTLARMLEWINGRKVREEHP